MLEIVYIISFEEVILMEKNYQVVFDFENYFCYFNMQVTMGSFLIFKNVFLYRVIVMAKN